MSLRPSPSLLLPSSPDLALFVLRALNGLDVLTGASKQAVAASAGAEAPAVAGQPAAAGAEAGGRRPSSGRQEAELASPQQPLLQNLAPIL